MNFELLSTVYSGIDLVIDDTHTHMINDTLHITNKEKAELTHFGVNNCKISISLLRVSSVIDARDPTSTQH